MQVTELEKTTKGISDAAELLELAESENDEGAARDIERDAQSLEADVRRLELKRMFHGEMDSHSAFMDIQAGAGGTEAQDWAQMLLRMYMRWAEGRGYKVALIDESAGEEAGIKSATLEIKGENAYGWLKTESGVHRLVRISPFDSNARRHTSFSSVWVYPIVDDNIEIDIRPDDIDVTFTRSSGAGGQHVNRTESAVRIVHKPSGIVIFSQEGRSQHKNRDAGMKRLKARLYELELQKREQKAQAEAASKSEIGWGHQIRSYVFQPYQMVKDLRTGVQTSDVPAVMDGDIDPFIEAALAQRVKGGAVDVEDID